MQDRYVSDVRDFVKYGLLRAALRLGSPGQSGGAGYVIHYLIICGTQADVKKRDEQLRAGEYRHKAL